MKKILFIILTLFGSIIFFELFLEYSPFKSGVSPVEYDKDIGMWHKKNFSSYAIRSCYENKYFFDSEGRVKNSYEYDKNKKNIIILGDSYIDASMVEYKKIIHNSLYRELNGDYNVLNYGLTGSGPIQQLAILKNKVSLSNISKVIHFINIEGDLFDCDAHNFNGSNRPKIFMQFKTLDKYEIFKPREYSIQEKIRDFLGNFELYSYLNKAKSYYFKLSNKDISIDTKQVVKLNKNREAFQWKQLKGIIYQFKKLAKVEKFEYIVIIKSSKKNNSKIIEKFLTEQKINFLNINSFLKDLEKKHLLGFTCDGHWNAQTHEELAKYISQKIFLNNKGIK